MDYILEKLMVYGSDIEKIVDCKLYLIHNDNNYICDARSIKIIIHVFFYRTLSFFFCMRFFAQCCIWKLCIVSKYR